MRFTAQAPTAYIFCKTTPIAFFTGTKIQKMSGGGFASAQKPLKKRFFD